MGCMLSVMGLTFSKHSKSRDSFQENCEKNHCMCMVRTRTLHYCRANKSIDKFLPFLGVFSRFVFVTLPHLLANKPITIIKCLAVTKSLSVVV